MGLVSFFAWVFGCVVFCSLFLVCAFGCLLAWLLFWSCSAVWVGFLSPRLGGFVWLIVACGREDCRPLACDSASRVSPITFLVSLFRRRFNTYAASLVGVALCCFCSAVSLSVVCSLSVRSFSSASFLSPFSSSSRFLSVGCFGVGPWFWPSLAFVGLLAFFGSAVCSCLH